MNYISEEARARLLELSERSRAAALAVYDAALEEAARIHGRDDAPSLVNLRAFREVIAKQNIADDPSFTYLCAEITGELFESSSEPIHAPLVFEPERLEGARKYLLLFGHAPRWWIRFLLFCGFDAWMRPTKL